MRRYPLSKSEEGIYISSLNSGDAYNLAHVVNLGKDVSLDKVKGALKKVFEAHPYLFTVLSIDENGNIVKSISPSEVEVKLEEVKELKIDSKPYELLNSPLYRFKLYKVNDEYVFYFDFHHIIMDGSSIHIFINDFFNALENKELVKEKVDANEYSLKEKESLGSKEYEASKEYYEKLVGGVETDSTPVEDKADKEVSYGNIRIPLDITDEEVKSLTKKLKVKTSSFFLSTFSYLLSKINMENESLFLTVHNGRDESISRSVGSYVKTYPLYLSYLDEDKVSDYLLKTNEQVINNVKNNVYPFADMNKDLGVSADVLFAYQGDYFYSGEYKNKLVEVTPLLRKDGKEKLSVEVHRLNGKFLIWVEYRSDLYLESTIKHLIKEYNIVMKEFLKKERLIDVDLLDEKETKLLDSFNNTNFPYIEDNKTILDDFLEVVKKYPNEVAVVFKDKKFTYKEVDEISTRIANELIKLGAKKEKVVSILVKKSEYIVLASLGVIKSGAAYQPLDPTYPKDRLSFMVKDSSAIILIRDRELNDLVEDFDGKEIFTDELLSFKDNSEIKTKPSPKDLFIMLYTSGSTGVPKGVMLEHGNIFSFCRYYRNEFGLKVGSKNAAYASYGFDADMMDLYPSLTSGATVYIIPDEMRLNLVELGEYFNQNGITHAFMTTQVGRQFISEIKVKSLQYFMVGGEKLVPMDPPKGVKFYNLYGPTEGTVFCSSKLVDKYYHRIPIGKCLTDYKIYVLDKNKKRLPILASGELYISGPQVARGYLNREKENNEAFLKNNFTKEEKFERLYKTGDIVRLLEDGTIDFIGRKDGQVKIRGFRVELSEVEKVIRDYPNIKDATVKDFTDPSGVKYIVAYVVSDSSINVEDLNNFILKRKPPYMVPAYTMQIDKIPLNQNQKVNKRALPVPDIKVEEKVAPRNKDEQDIFDILKDVLGHDQFGVTNDIFEVGLTSVSSIRFTILLSKKYGKSVDSSDLKAHSSISSLASFLLNKEEDKTYEEQDEYPLTKTQEGIFVECVSKANSTNYNIPYLFKLDKKMDLNKLKESVIKTIDNHPYLKSTLHMLDSGDVVLRRNNEPAKVEIINKEIDKSTLVRPFSILDSSLYRVEIYEGKDNYLFLDFHHILCDGTSEAIILNDINEAYLGKDLVKESYSGFEVALKEKDDLASDKLKNAKDFYNNVLKDVDGEYVLKKDLKVEEESKLKSVDKELKVDNNVVSNFVSGNKLTNNALFNFAFAFTLSKFIYKDDSLYETIYNGRKSSKVMNTVSMLVKTLPVYIKYQEDEAILSKVKEMQELLLGLEENDLYSFGDVANDYNLKANIIFAYQGDNFNFEEIGGFKVTPILLESDTPKSDFGLDIFLENGKYRAHYEWDEAIYNDETINSFNRLYELVLNELLTKTNIKDINCLPKVDEELYKKFNNTDVEMPKDITVNKLLEGHAETKPDKVAVIAKNGKLTYKELNENANKVAHNLLDLGVSLGECVVMFMPRIKEAYVVRQGIVKSGGAFVPVDPKYPDERVNYIITDSRSKYLISTREIIDSKKDLIKATKVKAIAIEDILDSKKITNPNIKIPQSSMAYVIYTSGSTGKPKGVMIAHKNLLNYVLDGSNLATIIYREIGKECVSCSFASLSFDASLQEEFVPLTHGYTAVIASEEEIENPMLLAKTLKENQVKYMFMTPSFVSNLLDIDEFVDALKEFKALDMGAEAVPMELCNRLRSLGVNAKLLNGYGPTETTITATYSVVKDKYMTIGSPIANTKVHILDKHGHILPINAIGDLTISGESVGLGYLGLKEKTEEAFIKVDGLNAYRSGDMARVNSEGNVEFFGRLDNQVKLRGLRVELDEIERVLNSYPSVTRSIILVKSSTVEGDYLAAYFTASSQVNKDNLLSHMGKYLTPYMVPKVVMQLDKFPLTPNGKIDKKSLPEIEVKFEQKEIKSASNELEEKLLSLFKKALGKDNVGVDDDFFELGGTSLSVSKVAMLALNMGLPIAYGDVFDYSTVLELEEHIKSISNETSIVNEEKTIKAELSSLAHNVVEKVNDIKEDFKVKKVLLTGSTGFLGIHILKELMDQKVNVVALIIGGKLDPKQRLLGLLTYYFDSPLIEEVDKYVSIVDGDVTDETLYDKLKDYDFNLIINSAAIVKHFSNDDIIERVNVGGVKNLIEIAKKKSSRLIQISTLSVAGENIDEKFAPSFRMKENMLDFGQDVSNKYVHSKFEAEKALLEAVDKGELDGKIIRVGNLMSRQKDGEFQANSITNGFMRDLKGYVTLHKFPVNSMDIEVDFSPIDEVAKTILLLAKTPKQFTVFHSANSHMVQMGDIIYVLNELGFDIEVTSDDEFVKSMKEMMLDDSKSMLVSSLISYSSSDMHRHSFILSDNEFSNKSLYHLGYKWPITDYNYLKNAIDSLATLDFFNRTDV